MVEIPLRIEFLIIRYISGSDVRSSSTCVCLWAMDHARDGRVGQYRQSMSMSNVNLYSAFS